MGKTYHQTNVNKCKARATMLILTHTEKKFTHTKQNIKRHNLGKRANHHKCVCNK